MNIYKGNIIADIKRGNKNAFKKLFDDYFPILCVFSFHYVEDKEVCKDIVQESFLSYWERKENFDDLLKVKSFLYTVTRNKCLNHLKHEQLDISHLVEQEDTDSDHETIIIEQETYRLVRKAVEELPSKMKISEGTVHTLKKIAYRKLRDKLKDINYILLLFLCK